jgi:hypothetical protein
VGLTDYFTMRVTNSSMDERLADGERIERRYAGALDDLAGSQLANPLATNLSIVTADRMIFVSQRSLRVACNPVGYRPAVSGTRSPLLDCDADGRNNPFSTAQREAFEEAIRNATRTTAPLSSAARSPIPSKPVPPHAMLSTKRPHPSRCCRPSCARSARSPAASKPSCVNARGSSISSTFCWP